MLDLNRIRKACNSFRDQYSTDLHETGLAVALHLRNHHRLDHASALEQTSGGSGDHGIDGWHYDSQDNILTIYQSKLSTTNTTVLAGFKDFETKALRWLHQALNLKHLETPSHYNHVLYNFMMNVEKISADVREIHFVLLSPFDKEELIGTNRDNAHFERLHDALAASDLNRGMHAKSRQVKLIGDVRQYELIRREAGAPDKRYDISWISDSKLLRGESSLVLAYVTLASLVEMLRRRGPDLFHENVRLPVWDSSKRIKSRLKSPVLGTLDAISKGKLAPEMFAFYHVGVTVSAAACELLPNGTVFLERPHILNGCQTVTLAKRHLDKLQEALERGDLDKALEIQRFNSVKVVAKIVTNLSPDELHEVTNANNRQAPIESWQLFCGREIHRRFEDAFKSAKIIYERQAGKVALIAKTPAIADYANSNKGAFLSVTQLGQILALAQGRYNLASAPGLIFESKKIHDAIFRDTYIDYAAHIVFTANALKAGRKALDEHLEGLGSTNQRRNERWFSKKGHKTTRLLATYLAACLLFAKANGTPKHKYHDVVKKLTNELYKKSSSSLKNAIAEQFVDLLRPLRTRLEAAVDQKTQTIVEERYRKVIDGVLKDLGIASEALPFGAHPDETLAKSA